MFTRQFKHLKFSCYYAMRLNINTVRCLSNIQSGKVSSKSVPKYDWHSAVTQAEKVVGYPTSFFNLRWLLSDEIANVALHLKELVKNKSNHPLIETAKNLFYDGKSDMPAWGLIVLLVSKAMGHSQTISDLEQDKSAGVLHSQRALAEIAEMIRTGHLIHQGLLNLQPLEKAGNELSCESEMIFGNKVALLSGDHILTNAFVKLALLRNQDLMELISSALRDLTESNFIGDRDTQNNPLPFDPANTVYCRNDIDTSNDFHEDELDTLKPVSLKNTVGNPEKEWTARHILSSASLLGKSCQGTLKIAGHSESLQKQGYLLGKNLALAWQTCIDIRPFKTNTIPFGSQFSLVSAPVLFHLDYDSNLYKEISKGKNSVKDIDYQKIHEIILSGPGLNKTRDLQKKHNQAAMSVLDQFPSCDARTALQNIIFAMQD